MNPECISRGRGAKKTNNKRRYSEAKSTGWRVAVPFVLLLASLVSPNDAVGKEEETSEVEANPYRLWVQMCDATGLEPSALADVEHEVSSIYAQAGVQIQWVEGCGGRRIESIHPGAARVYILEQIPKALLGYFYHLKQNNSMMGFTPTDAGSKPGPAIYVSRDSVEAHATEFHSMPLSESQLSRALARVVSHELAHRFLGQTEHTRTGILRVDFDRRTLTNVRVKNLGFTKEQSQMLHQWARRSVSEQGVLVGSSGS